MLALEIRASNSKCQAYNNLCFKSHFIDFLEMVTFFPRNHMNMI